ncbi:hypothetical protein SARC_04165 [Sphaeroforma arctica JP610]|uniref:Uncharacterized protein n=1 Tax=Sphaeroforma arctica JP610 TaxID=667725 RepID=A0A0L0G451_9EUKA|nr:hypothetical protein SARC_04165 [Sphaeroforma arctica JP610]KNC83581.1 hypothetical protein SARC_04165 [Sphaeroforma arctica JP610]|eukprot:XP_014157483.1 hypothetical protein SARC_04165 [Sphaeroforma arctica JP610]
MVMANKRVVVVVVTTEKPRARGKKVMKKRHKPRRPLERVAGGVNERFRSSVDSDSSTEDSTLQPTAASSASEVSSGDDDCRDIMSDSDISSDENITWPTMGYRPLTSVSEASDSNGSEGCK